MEQRTDQICRAVLAFLMAAGVCLAAGEITGETIAYGALWCLNGAFCVALSFWGDPEKSGRKGMWAVSMLLLLLFAFWFRSGWLVLSDRLFRLYESYYGIRIPLQRMQRCGTGALTGALFTLGGFCALGTFYGLSQEKKQLLYMIQMPLVVLALLLLGGVCPGFLPLALCILSGLGGQLYRRLERTDSRRMRGKLFGAFLLAAALMFLAAGGAQNVVYRTVQRQKNRIEAKVGSLEDLRWDVLWERWTGKKIGEDPARNGDGETAGNQMGVAGGQIADAGNLIPGDDVVLRLTEMESGIRGEIYLKAYGADAFQDNNWISTLTAETEGKYRDLVKLRGLLSGKMEEGTIGALFQNPRQILYRYDESLAPDTMFLLVENVGADDTYLYVPGAAWNLSGVVAADYTDYNYARPQTDEAAARGIWEVQTLSSEELLEGLAAYGIQGLRERSAFAEEMQVYADYAQGQYLYVNYELQEELRPLMDAAGIADSYHSLRLGMTDYTACLEAVRTVLWSKASYTYAPGQVPAGKNLISWFLLENGKGYCTHFASAGVMLFRMLGVPARYCEGYKVTGHGERELDVLQKNAHAWVEIFVEQVGWIPVEVTPGYEGGNIPESLGGEPETEEPEQVNPETEAVPETDPGSESGKEESGSVWRTRLLMVVFVILCAVALSGLAVMAWQQFQSRRRRLKRDGTRNTNRTVQICFEEYARIRKQYRDRMAEWPVSEAEEKRCREIYEEAVYSTHRIGKEETESVKKMRNRAIAGCRNRLTGKDRLLFFLRYPKKPD